MEDDIKDKVSGEMEAYAALEFALDIEDKQNQKQSGRSYTSTTHKTHRSNSQIFATTIN
jgi:hypothetical protein